MTATAGIDPIIVKILEAVPIQLVSPDGPQASRDAYRAIATARPPWIEVANIEDRTIPGPAGEIPVRIYSPAEGGVRPVFVLIHGGGWVIGDLDTHDAVARAAAVQADAVVVSVDYRLAPEHPYPAAVEDCWAALQWVHEHAAEIGGDPGRLAVGGDSAGGNLSAVMAQLARDNGIDLAFQVLWYPATTFDTTLPSMVENAEAPVLDFKTVGALSKWYLGDTNPATAGPTLVPARAENFEGLAPAFIGTAQFDPLRDDGAKYAELLRDAGVPVQLHNAPTLIHGYLGYADIVPSATEERDLSWPRSSRPYTARPGPATPQQVHEYAAQQGADRPGKGGHALGSRHQRDNDRHNAADTQRDQRGRIEAAGVVIRASGDSEYRSAVWVCCRRSR